MNTPTCHPDRQLHCKGLCKQCYAQQYYETNKARWTPEHGYVGVGREPIIPTCHPDRPHAANGLCRICYNKTPERQAAIKAYTDKHSRRDKLKHLYGITEVDYQRMLDNQHGVCAICKQPPRGKTTRLFVDHDHDTGLVRGLLCITCNRALGYFENPEWRQQAERYLEYAKVFAQLNTPN